MHHVSNHDGQYGNMGHLAFQDSGPYWGE
jgi:hypothetical protein